QRLIVNSEVWGVARGAVLRPQPESAPGELLTVAADGTVWAAGRPEEVHALHWDARDSLPVRMLRLIGLGATDPAPLSFLLFVQAGRTAWEKNPGVSDLEVLPMRLRRLSGQALVQTPPPPAAYAEYLAEQSRRFCSGQRKRQRGQAQKGDRILPACRITYQ